MVIHINMEKAQLLQIEDELLLSINVFLTHVKLFFFFFGLKLCQCCSNLTMGNHESMIEFTPYSYRRTSVSSETFCQSGKVFVDNTQVRMLTCGSIATVTVLSCYIVVLREHFSILSSFGWTHIRITDNTRTIIIN